MIANIHKHKNFITVHVPVIFFEEDNIHYASVPALDVTGYGKTEKEALKSLQFSVSEFLKDAAEDNILDAELKKLGWIKTQVPELGDTIVKNEQVKNIFNTRSVRTDKIDVNIPAYC